MPAFARTILAASSCLFLFALPVAAQDAEFSDAVSASYSADVAEMLVSRFASKPAEFPGYESGPDRTLEDQVAAFGEALAEDARYRTLGAVEAALRDLSPSQEIDGDYRVVKDPHASRPSKGVCQITSSFKVDDQTVFLSGTAFFVAPRVLVTNAHLVYNSALGGKASQVAVSPARTNQVEPFGSQESSIWYYPDGFPADEANSDLDFAWLILPDRTLYRRVGFYFGSEALSDLQLASKNLQSMGYSITDWENDKFRMLRDMERKNQQIFDIRFVHYHDAGPGAGGMPLFYRDGNKYNVVGVHVGATQGKANLAVRMVDQYIEHTKALKKKYP